MRAPSQGKKPALQAHRRLVPLCAFDVRGAPSAQPDGGVVRDGTRPRPFCAGSSIRAQDRDHVFTRVQIEAVMAG